MLHGLISGAQLHDMEETRNSIVSLPQFSFQGLLEHKK